MATDNSDDDDRIHAILDKKDGGLNFRKLHRIIQTLEDSAQPDSDYMRRFREAGLKQWAPQRVEDFMMVYRRALELAAGTLRHMVSEFEQPYSGKEFQFSWIIMLSAMPFVMKDPLHLNMFAQILHQSANNSLGAKLAQAAGQELPAFELQIPKFD